MPVEYHDTLFKIFLYGVEVLGARFRYSETEYYVPIEPGPFSVDIEYPMPSMLPIFGSSFQIRVEGVAKDNFLVFELDTNAYL